MNKIQHSVNSAWRRYIKKFEILPFSNNMKETYDIYILIICMFKNFVNVQAVQKRVSPRSLGMFLNKRYFFEFVDGKQNPTGMLRLL